MLTGRTCAAGLAGFGVAYALSKAGHKVKVFERQPALGMPAGGLRVPPNMSKLLKKWVGAEELAKSAVLNVATPWYDCACARRPQQSPRLTTLVLRSAHWRADGRRAVEAGCDGRDRGRLLADEGAPAACGETAHALIRR